MTQEPITKEHGIASRWVSMVRNIVGGGASHSPEAVAQKIRQQRNATDTANQVVGWLESPGVFQPADSIIEALQQSNSAFREQVIVAVLEQKDKIINEGYGHLITSLSSPVLMPGMEGNPFQIASKAEWQTTVEGVLKRIADIDLSTGRRSEQLTR